MNDFQVLNQKIKILSEEYEVSPETFMDKCFWIIDPIDGLRSYIRGENEYTINIALIYKGVPYLGLIAHPPSKKVWYAIQNKLQIIENGKVKSYVRNLITKKSL